MIKYNKNNNIQPDIKSFYREVNGLKLPVYVFNPQEKNNKNEYVVICIHGGAWRTGIKADSEWTGGDMLPQAKIFAQLGYIGVAISYRSIDNENTDIMDIIDDCKEAVRYIKKTLKVDNEHIILIGDSAGAHLATSLGICDDDDIRPQFVISCNPVLDCMSRFSFVSNDETIRELASPIRANIKKCSDFLFIHGDNDSTTPIEDTVFMNERLKQLGFKTEMITLEGARHAFILYDYVSTDEEVEKCMDMIADYLDKHIN